MSDIIKIIKSSEDPCVLIDRVIEIVKHEIRKREVAFLGALLAPLAASLVQPVISSLVKGIRGRGVRRWIKIFCSTPSFKQYQDY